jgi:hypothetical protein
MIEKLILIVQYLTTDRKYKGHGYWLTYEDDKIKIMFDTYYPNASVYVKLDGKEQLVLLHSGHGYNQEYHPGNWEKYVDEILYLKAVEARNIYDLEQREREELDNLNKFGAIDDSKVFN